VKTTDYNAGSGNVQNCKITTSVNKKPSCCQGWPTILYCCLWLSRNCFRKLSTMNT